MTDAELIQMLRRRLATVEGAAMDLIDVFERTGNERKAARDAINDARYSGERAISARDFIEVFDATMPERADALAAFSAALTTDLNTALLSDPNVTPEQIAEWVK